MSAMRSSWRELESLGGWKADQSTCQDLGSTKNTIPLLRPKVELAAESASLFEVAAGPAAGCSSFLSADSLRAAGLAGFPNRSASLFSKAEPSRSVKTASASFESVTTWKTRWFVKRLARYWSSPRYMGSRYTECTPERFWPHTSAPEKREKQQEPLD